MIKKEHITRCSSGAHWCVFIVFGQKWSRGRRYVYIRVWYTDNTFLSLRHNIWLFYFCGYCGCIFFILLWLRDFIGSTPPLLCIRRGTRVGSSALPELSCSYLDQQRKWWLGTMPLPFRLRGRKLVSTLSLVAVGNEWFDSKKSQNYDKTFTTTYFPPKINQKKKCFTQNQPVLQ